MKKICHTRHVLFFLLGLFLVSCHNIPDDTNISQDTLSIYPDYTHLVIPPNIAPMNFRIKNQGNRFLAVIENRQGKKLRIKDRSGLIHFSLKSWRRLLEDEPGGELQVTIYRKTDNGWERFESYTNTISREKIDPFISYRKIPPSNIQWDEMGIYQRCIEDYSESPIMVNTLSENNCMNCHTFNGGNPEQFLFHMRGAYGGTFIQDKGSYKFINTKSGHTRASGVYPSWHPNGKIVAFSVNKISQGFHSVLGKICFVHDKYSDIILYDLERNSITRPAELAGKNLENLPSWSTDGKKLYYINTGPYSENKPYDSVFYSLLSFDFNEDKLSFENPDTVVCAEEFGKSITFPNEAPRGDIISFIGVDYGYFSIYNNEADIYFYQKKTGQIIKPPLNSEFTESYPTWSANGAWLMFVSKREDGILSQVWFSYVDENGQAGKPFVLPQRDPDMYTTYMHNYNRPKFMTGRVKLNPRKIMAMAEKGTSDAQFDEDGSVSLSSGATIVVSEDQDVHYEHN